MARLHQRHQQELAGLGEDDGAEIITLVSKDEREIRVSKRNAQISSLIKNVVDSDPNAERVPIPGVLGAHLELVGCSQFLALAERVPFLPLSTPFRALIMFGLLVGSQVVEYMNHHEGVDPAPVEKPLRSKHLRDVCKDVWDADFIDKIGEQRQMLYDIILAANYMDIKSLLHLGCAKVASLIKGQPLEKIKDILAVS